MAMHLRHAVGSLMVVGLSGADCDGDRPSALNRAWLKLVRPAGIILFRRNIANAAQTRSLLAEATALCAPHSLRCVDLEGGMVDRLRDTLAPMPSAQAVSLAATQSGKPQWMREHGELVARAVNAFGFNTTLAPVLDLRQPASASVLGTRAVSANPVEVVQYARAFLAGLAAHGVVGCGKHFPGLGAGALDSHLETPVIQRTMRELNNDDLYPYCELRDELPMVMVNHAAYPATPGRAQPASVSRFWITTVLRQRIGFRGLIFSDDLEMGGILTRMSIEEAAVEAIRAGMNLIEICHSPELILRAFEALLAEAERSRAFETVVKKRARDGALLRAKPYAQPTPRVVSAKQYQALRTSIERFGATIASAHSPSEATRA